MGNGVQGKRERKKVFPLFGGRGGAKSRGLSWRFAVVVVVGTYVEEEGE